MMGAHVHGPAPSRTAARSGARLVPVHAIPLNPSLVAMPHHFAGAHNPLPMPSARALGLLDRAIISHWRSASEEASALDGPAAGLMARVQTEVSAIWPYASVACFGSRATGLACATSDIDLVITGVPHLDTTPMGFHQHRYADGCHSHPPSHLHPASPWPHHLSPLTLTQVW